MLIFTENEAQHFCAHYSEIGNKQESIKVFLNRSFRGRIGTIRVVREGTPQFDELRSYLLRYVDRFLLLSCSNYHSACRLMSTGSSSWAHVTLYYGSFFAARALMGMFGSYIDTPFLIEVETGNAGIQELKILKVQSNRAPLLSITRQTGSHRIFWDLFYQTVSALLPYVVDVNLNIGLSPVSGDPIWQIQRRNEINYNAMNALGVMHHFENGYKRTTFPRSLSGELRTQFTITESLTLLAFDYAKKLGINTDAFSLLPGRKERKYKIKRFISKPNRGAPITAGKKAVFES